MPIWVLFIFILIGLIVIVIFLRDNTFEKEEVNPVDYGWEPKEEIENHYSKPGGWILYKSDTGRWVLDKIPKNGPGVVGRFTELTQIDMEEINDLCTLENPTRIRFSQHVDFLSR